MIIKPRIEGCLFPNKPYSTGAMISGRNFEEIRPGFPNARSANRCRDYPRQSNLYEYMEHSPVNDFSIDFIWKCTLSSRISRPCLMTSKPAKWEALLGDPRIKQMSGEFQSTWAAMGSSIFICVQWFSYIYICNMGIWVSLKKVYSPK